MEGLYSLPTTDVGKGLTNEWVLLNLNKKNCFDVDYAPQEGDNLVIEKNAHNYLSFIFQNGSWEIGHYNPFVTIQTLNSKGEVKQVGSIL